ncbi:MAG TPA: restriction endonuclease [Candidatus Angelobacter sp.]
MAIPAYQAIMLPMLRLARDGKEYSIADLVSSLLQHFNLSKEERSEMLPSGKEPIFRNRTRWARWYLLKAGLLADPHRGTVQITPEGLQALQKGGPKIELKELLVFSPVGEKGHKVQGDARSDEKYTETPEELIESGYQRLRKEIEAELLTKVKKCSPKFFEQLVMELMLKLGYGGSFRDAGIVTGKSGDRGIDGVIKEDKLGFDFICIQAKRWDTGPISREDVQKFVGALHGQKANKGIFITTTTFAKTAVEYAQTIQNKIVLIDGDRLAELMFETGLGLSVVTTYEMKKIDADYFLEDEGVATSTASI